MAFSKEQAINYTEEKIEIESNAIDVKTFDKMNKVLAVARKAVCKVNSAHTVLGTAALYDVVDPSNINRFLIMRCNDILQTTSLIETTTTIFEFEDIEKMKHLALTRDHV